MSFMSKNKKGKSMPKIIIDVPDNDCDKCILNVNGDGFCQLCNDHTKDERLPDCIAAEVDNLFNKHLENVLKE